MIAPFLLERGKWAVTAVGVASISLCNQVWALLQPGVIHRHLPLQCGSGDASLVTTFHFITIFFVTRRFNCFSCLFQTWIKDFFGGFTDRICFALKTMSEMNINGTFFAGCCSLENLFCVLSGRVPVATKGPLTLATFLSSSASIGALGAAADVRSQFSTVKRVFQQEAIALFHASAAARTCQVCTLSGI